MHAGAVKSSLTRTGFYSETISSSLAAMRFTLALLALSHADATTICAQDDATYALACTGCGPPTCGMTYAGECDAWCNEWTCMNWQCAACTVCVGR